MNINERTAYFALRWPALLYYWSLKWRGYPVAKPKLHSLYYNGWHNVWTVECPCLSHSNDDLKKLLRMATNVND